MRFEIEDIFFWILVLAAIIVILWLLKGSPTIENSIISIGLFIISSELLLWRKYFEIDKNVGISFAKLKYDIIHIKNDLINVKENLSIISSNHQDIKNELITIRKLIK